MEFLSVENLQGVDIQRHIHNIVRVLLHTSIHPHTLTRTLALAQQSTGKETRKRGNRVETTQYYYFNNFGYLPKRQTTAVDMFRKPKLSQDFSRIFQQLYFNFFAFPFAICHFPFSFCISSLICEELFSVIMSSSTFALSCMFVVRS